MIKILQIYHEQPRCMEGSPYALMRYSSRVLFDPVAARAPTPRLVRGKTVGCTLSIVGGGSHASCRSIRGSWVYRFILVLIYAAIGGIFFFDLVRHSLNYKALLRITTVAMTPAIILGTVQGYLDYTFP